MARLIQSIATSGFSSPSPDPAGIVYIDDSNTLLISDSEINETPLFEGDNLFEINTSGNIINIGNILDFSDEPTGLAYNSANNILFISDDGNGSRQISAIRAGNDNIFGTSDDSLINAFSTNNFNSNDAEDLAFRPSSGTLFVSDGVDNTIYEITTSGSLVSSFSTSSFGLSDPEGIGYDAESGNLFIVGEPTTAVFEVTPSGNLVRTIDINSANPVQPAGIDIAPSSDGSGRSLYIVDRGIDERDDINENDGRLYEFALEADNPDNPDDPDNPDNPDNPGGDINRSFYATTRDTANIDGNSFEDEDIIFFNANNQTRSLFFDGSDVGLAGNDLDAIHVNSDGSILLSLNQDGNVDGLGFVDDADILRFVPTSTGNNTAGSFEVYFDGSDVGLDMSSEDIDSVSVAANGDLLISTNVNFSAGGLSGNDEDIWAFSASNLGSNTSGSFSLYVDASDIGLDTSSEDIKGLSILDSGELVLSSLGSFQVSGLSGGGSDLFSFNPSSIGDNTSGSFSSFSSGADSGLGSQVVADISVV